MMATDGNYQCGNREKRDKEVHEMAVPAPVLFFSALSMEIMDKIYRVSAPNTDIVMISYVLPDNRAMMPMIILTSKALDGVLNRG